MKSDEKKYNLFPCAVISVFGAILGALGLTGLIVPATVGILELLPNNWGIPPIVFVMVCRGGLMAIPAGLVMAWLITVYRSRRNRAGHLSKQRKLDMLLDTNDERSQK